MCVCENFQDQPVFCITDLFPLSEMYLYIVCVKKYQTFFKSS